MKYLKLILFYLITLITSNLFLAILSYFNITNNLFNSIFTIIILILTYLIIGVYLGKNSYKNIYIEGLKMILIFTLLGLIISFIFKFNFGLKNLLYYILNSIVLLFGCKLGKEIKK